MIMGLKNIIEDHYDTYADTISGRREGFILRLSIQFTIAFLLVFLSNKISETAIAVFVTALSILAGFSFSALFPIASDIKVGLPAPKYSDDRDDLRRLSRLASYFRSNVSYFMPLTMVCIISFSFLLIEFNYNLGDINFLFVFGKYTDSFIFLVDRTCLILVFLMRIFSFFLFFEVIYTFYRMSFNVLYILRIREEYRVSHENRSETRG